MAALITLVIVVILSILVTKIGAVALRVTGMSRDSARFQARSAFTGAGFTTSESEAVVDHPMRRRIISMLILLGNAGVASAVATLLLTFGSADDAGSTLTRAFTLSLVVVVLLALGRSEVFNRWLTAVIKRVIGRTTELEVRDYAALLNIRDGWTVVELDVHDPDWLAHRQLKDLHLPEEGVLVLGIHRADGGWDGAPSGEDVFRGGDTVVLYGPKPTLTALDDRGRDSDGAREHQRYRDALERYKAARTG